MHPWYTKMREQPCYLALLPGASRVLINKLICSRCPSPPIPFLCSTIPAYPSETGISYHTNLSGSPSSSPSGLSISLAPFFLFHFCVTSQNVLRPRKTVKCQYHVAKRTRASGSKQTRLSKCQKTWPKEWSSWHFTAGTVGMFISMFSQHQTEMNALVRFVLHVASFISDNKIFFQEPCRASDLHGIKFRRVTSITS